MPAALVLLTGAALSPADPPVVRDEKLLAYRLRGEVRPLLFWLGRDDVGGGRITIRRECASPLRWTDEIEVLFGSEPERIPGRISRWGYGLEKVEWVRQGGASPPRLAATEFQGIMRHSTEASMTDVIPESRDGNAAHPYDVTRSIVLPELAKHEFRFFTDAEEFHYRRPERILERYRECLVKQPPLRSTALANKRASMPNRTDSSAPSRTS